MEETVRNNFKSLRVRAGLNQLDVAKKMNLTRQQIMNYEKRPLKVKIETLIKLSLIYGCRPTEFIERR